MKRYAELKRTLTEELGFTDLAAYKKWIAEVRPNLKVTRAMVERLSPDAIDNRDFWRLCDELFGTDPVANAAVGRGELAGEAVHAIDANRNNLRLAKTFAVTSFLEEHAGARLDVLEIGPGYGSLQHWIEANTNHRWTGVDVVPRVPGVVETTSDGALPRELVERRRGSFAYVVSSNVFQHLSPKQRTRYYLDAAELLQHGGLFLFNLYLDTPKLPSNVRDEEGRAYCDHYGQYTEIPKAGELYDELARSFDILYVTQRYDALFHFVAQKTR